MLNNLTGYAQRPYPWFRLRVRKNRIIFQTERRKLFSKAKRKSRANKFDRSPTTILRSARGVHSKAVCWRKHFDRKLSFLAFKRSTVFSSASFTEKNSHLLMWEKKRFVFETSELVRWLHHNFKPL